ncbi:MAG: hypothetical protein CMF59_08945 [Leptospiraceae bacterium]|nr:hypothetical protein [Leptospiraceae bacterium]
MIEGTPILTPLQQFIPYHYSMTQRQPPRNAKAWPGPWILGAARIPCPLPRLKCSLLEIGCDTPAPGFDGSSLRNFVAKPASNLDDLPPRFDSGTVHDIAPDGSFASGKSREGSSGESDIRCFESPAEDSGVIQ